MVTKLIKKENVDRDGAGTVRWVGLFDCGLGGILLFLHDKLNKILIQKNKPKIKKKLFGNFGFFLSISVTIGRINRERCTKVVKEVVRDGLALNRKLTHLQTNLPTPPPPQTPPFIPNNSTGVYRHGGRVERQAAAGELRNVLFVPYWRLALRGRLREAACRFPRKHINAVVVTVGR